MCVGGQQGAYCFGRPNHGARGWGSIRPSEGLRHNGTSVADLGFRRCCSETLWCGFLRVIFCLLLPCVLLPNIFRESPLRKVTINVARCLYIARKSWFTPNSDVQATSDIDCNIQSSKSRSLPYLRVDQVNFSILSTYIDRVDIVMHMEFGAGSEPYSSPLLSSHDPSGLLWSSAANGPSKPPQSMDFVSPIVV